MHIRSEESLFPFGVYEPAEGRMAADQVDGVVDAEVDQGLGEVVEGLVRLADGDE